jgi:hypothetical protein
MIIKEICRQNLSKNLKTKTNYALFVTGKFMNLLNSGLILSQLSQWIPTEKLFVATNFIESVFTKYSRRNLNAQLAEKN